MNQKSASSSKRETYDLQNLSFKEIPDQTKFFIDYLYDDAGLRKFYPNKNRDLADFADEILQNYVTDRDKLCEMLIEENENYEADGKTFENIEKLRDKNCVAVLTGQQAGLFSGPLYTIYKALSAIKLAEELESRGIKVVPIFWIASEDHDLDEIKKTFVINDDYELEKVENEPKNVVENVPVGNINFDNSIKSAVDELTDKLSSTEFSNSLKKLLSETYRDGDSYSLSFGKLLAKLFRSKGLIFVSPLNKKLRELSSNLFQEAME